MTKTIAKQCTDTHNSKRIDACFNDSICYQSKVSLVWLKIFHASLYYRYVANFFFVLSYLCKNFHSSGSLVRSYVCLLFRMCMRMRMCMRARALHLCIVYRSSKLEQNFAQWDAQHSHIYSQIKMIRPRHITRISSTLQNVLRAILFDSKLLLVENKCSFTHEMVLNQPRYHFTSFSRFIENICLSFWSASKFLYTLCLLHISN